MDVKLDMKTTSRQFSQSSLLSDSKGFNIRLELQQQGDMFFALKSQSTNDGDDAGGVYIEHP